MREVTTAEPFVAADADTKDWTWVLERACAACGVDAGSVPLTAVPRLLDEAAAAWTAVLGSGGSGGNGSDGDERLRRRPRPGVWSTTEYAAHVRDVHRVFDERLALVLGTTGEDVATFANWDQDAAAAVGRYDLDEPRQVAHDLAAASARVADRYAAVRPEDAGRRGIRSNGSAFTVTTLAQYHLHDVLHHLHDVGAPVPATALPTTDGSTA
ncbi:DinB family protein [Nocardioides zeae]|uniref:DinB family protein n=1 Tax=Nocardioides zeae TaxID=1457234 RepID=UPI003083EF5B